MNKQIRILFIDNFDSFTYNLVDEFEKRDCQIKVYRNNTDMEIIQQVIGNYKPNLIVISPGPSTPKQAGICIELIKQYYKVIPIFGVCLGHQCLIEAFGGIVDRCPEVIHGKPSMIYHTKKSILKNIENPFQAGRYHSLSAQKLPSEFEVLGSTQSEIVMAIAHRDYHLFGVQFHPESILTPTGGKIIDNVLEALK